MLALAAPLRAQNPPPAPPQTQSPPEQPEQKPAYEEQVVVSASRATEALVNAPAAVSVVTTATIESSPATNMGDLLRAVPGINVTQVSARDVNFTTRGATSTLATSQLALVDGRSIYLDFFGMVMWDLVPTSPHEIKQIEVVRGPASAVWGANAMSGVVNVITRTPRELAADGGGRSLTIGIGTFDRNVTGRDMDAGTLFYVNGSQAQAVNDRWSYKLAAGYLTQDPLPRPTGALPSGIPYPPFTNKGTAQPKFNARVDYDMPNGARLTFDGGVAGTEGIIHTGIGPFDIDSGSRLGYFTTRYEKGGRHIGFFTNLLHGDATNQLTVGLDGRPIDLAFDTKTFDVDASDIHTSARITCSRTAATTATTPSTSRWRRSGPIGTKAAPTCRTKCFSVRTSVGCSAGASTSTPRSTMPSSRRERPSCTSPLPRTRSAHRSIARSARHL
jgi:iron complex outermembrane receptor protein